MSTKHSTRNVISSPKNNLKKKKEKYQFSVAVVFTQGLYQNHLGSFFENTHTYTYSPWRESNSLLRQAAYFAKEAKLFLHIILPLLLEQWFSTDRDFSSLPGNFWQRLEIF